MPFDGKDFPKHPIEARLAVLREARKGVASAGGWRQNGWGFVGHHCAMGWLKLAMGVEMHSPTDAAVVGFTFETLMPVLSRQPGQVYLGDPVQQVIAFNDYHGTMQQDVVALFDRAIMRLEAHRLFHDFHGSTITNAPFNAVLAAADQKSSKTLSLA